MLSVYEVYQQRLSLKFSTVFLTHSNAPCYGLGFTIVISTKSEPLQLQAQMNN